MPRGSRAVVYGSLSLEPSRIDPTSLIFEGKQVEGFWLSDWLRNLSLFRQLQLTRHVQTMLTTEFKSQVQAKFPLEQVGDALHRYSTNMSAGKVLLVPCSAPGET
jgi:hypothetical protein